ncbi:T-box transcription factor TBX20 [Hypsibius exemplaris]|uniref:T-box transcription factor TBX20 n=1 Tax=Hypsibius exemplaris TaxID=2072580 RepID=A0A1W0WBY0_HYPEX|nr:T-box transcription factor TBX20 [Hypsibius exemplaris]
MDLKIGRKVTDFSISAIMGERDALVKKVAGLTDEQATFLPPSSPDVKPFVRRSCATPGADSLQQVEFPDTTTSDDDDALLIPAGSAGPAAAVVREEKALSRELLHVQCHLEMKELWEKFNDLGTEMIITRSGRRMFPTLRVSFSGLDMKTSYVVLLDVVTMDNKRYRYAYHRSSWLVAGKGDPVHSSKLYSHPDSPFSGEQLRKQIITFEKVKLTNTEVNKPGYIVLNSMHRYQPRIHLVVDRGEDNLMKLLKTDADLDNFDCKTFAFPECAFYSVTAYQNQLITKLKIDCNPFAKGFRDSTRVISDMERESINAGMSEHLSAYGSHGMLDCYGNSMDALMLSSKLSQFHSSSSNSSAENLMLSQGFRNYSLGGSSSIPPQVLQKWSLTAAGNWPTVEQRHLSEATAEFSRQLLWSKHLANTAGPFHPYFNIPNGIVGESGRSSKPGKEG